MSDTKETPLETPVVEKQPIVEKQPVIDKEDLKICLIMFQRAFKNGLVDVDEAYPVGAAVERIKKAVAGKQ